MDIPGMPEAEAQGVVVVPAEAGKRLIGRAVARLPQVQRAQRDGLLVVGWGTTNAYVLEELLGRPIPKGRYVAGYLAAELGVLPPAAREPMVVLERGEPRELAWPEVLARLGPGDVVIKGGNLLDPQGVVGVYVAGGDGGTVGKFLAPALARGVEVVIPISRSKAVHTSVVALAQRLGAGRLVCCAGPKIGVIPLLGTVVTETEAVSLLYGVRAEHIGGGGVGRGRGAVVLLLSGPRDAVERAFSEIAALGRSEPPLDVGEP
ncbi:MAG: hypothetical protein NZ924_02335 [Candidatus Bipolaricaulota bacterium]|nr:hypothetical protein [Candidatus Bipolaricaulota bacterium]MDW8151747.1 hypothetical protein [Candidatus Bipolaricaulota bacterium]